MVYIVLVNWNGYLDTINCISSLLKLNFKDFYIIVVDNDSNDDSVTFIKNYILDNNILNAKCISSGRNGGFSFGNNVGINYALKDEKCQYIWLLNNDTEVDENSLSALKDHLESDARIGICGSVLRYYYERDIIQAVGGLYNKYTGFSSHVLHNKPFSKSLVNDKHHIDYVVGASMFLSRKSLDCVGLLSEDFFLYCEEVDWCFRFKKFGYIVDYSPQSMVYHKEGAATLSGPKQSSLRNEYIDKIYLRSNLILAKKIGYVSHFFVRFFYIFRILRRVIAGDTKSALSALYAMIFVWK